MGTRGKILEHRIHTNAQKLYICVLLLFCRKCSKCSKKRSLRSHSIFSQFQKIPLGDAMLAIYFWAEGHSRKQTASSLGLSNNVVSRLYRVLEDVCSNEIEKYSPFLPFGGPGCIVQCDESKFNHKQKVIFPPIVT